MKKKEFLRKLNDSLCENISEKDVAIHIEYYNMYIDEEIRKGKSEKEVIEELGDPRLIAKTLVNSGGFSSSTNRNKNYYDSFSDVNDDDDKRNSGKNGKKTKKGILSKLTLKQKVKLFATIAIILAIFVLMFVYMISVVIAFIKLIIKFIVPICIIAGVYYIYKVLKE